MSLIRRAAHSPSTLIADDRGHTAVMFALMLPVLVGFLGLALDYGRSNYVKSRLQSAADSAALAGTNAVGNGATIAEATNLAQNVWTANSAAISAASIDGATINVSNASGAASTTVSYSGSFKTVFSGMLSSSSLPLTGSSTAKAVVTTTPSATYTGHGDIWGDPHLDGADGKSTEFDCPSPYWYNLLSDGGIELNISCKESIPGAHDIISDFSLMLGTHKVSLTTAVLDPITGNMPGPGWVNEVTIDGVTYSPPIGTTTVETLADVNATVTANIYSLDYTQVNGSNGAGSYMNNITITTPQYTILLGYQYQPQYGTTGLANITALNAGVCGLPGGLFGKTLGGIDDYTMTDYQLTAATSTSPEFNRTPCVVSTASKVRLTQ